MVESGYSPHFGREKGERPVLFTAVLKVKEGTIKDRVVRRAQWHYPDGVDVVGEYWLQSTDPAIPHVISVYEAESIAPIMALLADWDDVFDITVVPTITAQEGLELTAQMMQSQ